MSQPGRATRPGSRIPVSPAAAATGTRRRPNRPPSTLMRLPLSLLIVTCAALLNPAADAAGCQTELQVFAEDLRGKQLTQPQTQEIAGLLIEARRYCWVHQESVAMGLINRARGAAGLAPSTGEFDWENVPLDSLEKAN
jgi:hypothetical protein